VTSTYIYNADGIRIGKNSGGVVTEYVLNGTLILAEKRGDTIIRYIYDENGLPVGMILNNTPYLYEKNLQGDIIGIYTTAGTKVVTYAYDAWGNIINSSYTSGYSDVYTYNPFRYRGYYYDTETGFYYLQSRYYDPAVGRFINADGYINANGDLQGFNMYAYCSNNPVMYVDYTGEGFFSDLWWKIKGWFGGALSSTTTIYEKEYLIIPDPSPLTVTKGQNITQVVSQQGDSSKPYSVYANGDLKDPIGESSAGIRINSSNSTCELDIGLRNLSVMGMTQKDNVTYGIGLKIDFSELKIGIESFKSVQQGDIVEKTYTNVSVGGWIIIAAYCFVTTGQMIPCPA